MPRHDTYADVIIDADTIFSDITIACHDRYAVALHKAPRQYGALPQI